MPRKLLFGAIGVSLLVHVAVLLAFALILLPAIRQERELLVESVFADERVQEEFSQELDIDTDVSENLSVVAGGAVTDAVGAAAGPTVSQTRIETSETLKDPVLVANVGAISMPGEALLGVDLGAKAVMGETGAVVEGYGAAMSRISRELLRLMRERKVVVVWLFDESESMKDDQAEIRDQFHKVYEELGIAAKEATAAGRRGKAARIQDEALLTSIVGFGAQTHYLLETPTSDLPQIRAAIDKIAIDESGKENMCQAVRDVIGKYRILAGRQDRKLVVVIVSDESGDDGQFLEEAVAEAKRADAPIYILGREAVFGYPYARMRYVDEQYGLTHWLQVNRGPETAFVEALQWDGFGRRYDAYQSGFGPYEQVRLAKESGGIFFLLPGEEEDLTGPGSADRRKFDFLDMKEYQPKLESRREYLEVRQRSKNFRARIYDVIAALNPYEVKALDVREIHWPIELPAFREEAKKNFDKAVQGLVLANQAVAVLEQIKPFREREESHRWRAAYDLMYAQTLAYRVRLFQYLLVLDAQVKAGNMPKDPKNNVWNMRVRPKLLPPDPQQVKLTKVDPKELEKQLQQAEDLFGYVIEQHPGTPWARRAQHELSRGFGVEFVEGFRDPRYNRPDIKLPTL